MLIEPAAGGGYQRTVEPRFAAARLVAGHQDYGLPGHVEREGDAPNAAASVEAKLLHVGVLRILQRIYMRPSEQRTRAFQKARFRGECGLHGTRQLRKLGVKRLMKDDHPSHGARLAETNMS